MVLPKRQRGPKSTSRILCGYVSPGNLRRKINFRHSRGPWERLQTGEKYPRGTGRAASEAINRAYLDVWCFVLSCSALKVLGLDQGLEGMWGPSDTTFPGYWTLSLDRSGKSQAAKACLCNMGQRPPPSLSPVSRAACLV